MPNNSKIPQFILNQKAIKPFTDNRCNLILVGYYEKYTSDKSVGKIPYCSNLNDYFYQVYPQTTDPNWHINYLKYQQDSGAAPGKRVNGLALYNDINNVFSLDFDVNLDENGNPIPISESIIEEICEKLTGNPRYPFVEKTPKSGFHIFIKTEWSDLFKNQYQERYILEPPADKTKFCKHVEVRLKGITVCAPSISVSIPGCKYSWWQSPDFETSQVATVPEAVLIYTLSQYFDCTDIVEDLNPSKIHIPKQKQSKTEISSLTDENIYNFKGFPITPEEESEIRQLIEESHEFRIERNEWLQQFAFQCASCGYQKGLQFFIALSLNDFYPNDTINKITYEFNNICRVYIRNFNNLSISGRIAKPKSLIYHLKEFCGYFNNNSQQ